MHKTITSVNNEYIKSLNKLKIKKYRDEKQLFLIEGYHLIEMAKNSLQEILVSNENDLKIFPEIEHILVSNEIINKLALTQNPQGIIGVAKTNKNKGIEGDNVLLLDNIQDPGNVGTLIRSALAFNFSTIIMSYDSVDIYNDKVIRATQGSIFEENIVYSDLIVAIERLRKDGYKIYGSSLKNSKNISEFSFKKEKIAIILGNEGQGINSKILEITDDNILIPMSGKIESLNVGVAGSIIMAKIFKG